MPIEKTELETRIEELWKTIKTQGSEFITVNGNTLKEVIGGLVTENTDLKQKFEKLEKEGTEQKPSNEEAFSALDIVTKDEHELLKTQLAELEDKIANLQVGGNDIDLTKEFSSDLLSLTRTDLELDEVKPAISPEILNKALKVKGSDANALPKELLIQSPTFWKGYVIEPDRDLNLKQWITEPTSKFPKGSETVNNIFDTANPVEKDVVLGTGAGKTTVFARCFLFRQLGNEEIASMSESERKGKFRLTIVVPFDSLIGSANSAHNEWLNDEKTAQDNYNEFKAKYEETGEEKYLKIAQAWERVFKCPICEKKHTEMDGKPYEIVHNGPGFLNIYTGIEFLDAYVNRTNEINEWVLVDEGHEDTPIYQAIMIGLLGDKDTGKAYHSKIRPFKIARMSATFPDLPISKKLDGVMTDYYLTDFNKVDQQKHPNILGRKMIIFIDKPDQDELGNKVVWEKKDIVNKSDKVFDKIDLTALKKETKVLVLNDSLKDYATDIVQALEPPLLVIASRDYSVGFSFGDVIVTMTGNSTRQIVVDNKGNWEWKTVPGGMTLPDLLQGRGRGARSKFMNSVCFFLKNEFTREYKKEQRKDVTFDLLLKEFEKAKKGPQEMDKNVIKKIVDFYNRKKPIPELSTQEGKRYFNIMLIKDLKSKLSPIKLFNVTKEEKEKVEEKRKALLAKAGKTRDSETKKKILAAANALKVREPGEYIFESEMLKYFREEDLEKILKEATNDKLRKLRQNEKEDYVFDSSESADAAMCGFLLSCRDKTKYEAKVTQNSKGENVKLSIKFKSYKKIKEGTQIQGRTMELPNEVVYEIEKEEVWREALFEIPPKDVIGW